MKVTNHTVMDGATRVTDNRQRIAKPVAQPVQRQERKFTRTGRGGCTSCGKR